ncbi:MAG: dihydroorotate dehydrogenase electron transfer subunit [Vulcanimicrobiaceae bacterium]
MPLTRSRPTLHEAVIRDRREPAPGIVVLGLRAPELAAAALAGQFVMVVPPTGELASTALGIYEARGDRITLMLVVCGPRTRELAAQPVGATLGVLGPLGNGFALDATGDDVAIVAGGVGLASVLLAAQTLRDRGNGVTLYYGARTAAALVDAEKFSALGCTLALATDDGSRGHRGFVTELLARAGATHSSILACGPSPMLRAVARIALQLDVRAQLSLEETFACGVGACWGCVVPLDRASAQAPHFPPPQSDEPRGYVHARICVEGPVFWAHELKW